MSWTDDRVTSLKKLWNDGLSAGQIAKQLGGTTRNAVIGKVHRLGLSGRGAPSLPGARPSRTTSKARRPEPRLTKPVRPVKALDAPPQAPAPVSDRAFVPEAPGIATVLTIGGHMCRWPIGDPLKDGFTLCGRKAGRGSYCHEHAQVAFQPSTPESRKEAKSLARMLRRYL